MAISSLQIYYASDTISYNNMPLSSFAIIMGLPNFKGTLPGSRKSPFGVVYYGFSMEGSIDGPKKVFYEECAGFHPG